MHVQHFYDKETATLSYIVRDPQSSACAIIDPVLNFNPLNGEISYTSAQLLIDYVKQNDLSVEWILETHIHADHLTAAQYLKKQLGGKIGISSSVKALFEYWNPVYGLTTEGKQFDVFFDDNASFAIGGLKVNVLLTPGHTPACCCYVFENSLFVGDTLFRPAMGTSRADFPGGSAKRLYESIQKILAFPDHTTLYLCHDYPKEHEELIVSTTVGEQRSNNVMVGNETTLEDYTEKRQQRDNTLAPPKLMLLALQVNLMAGDLPFKAKNGQYYLKLPVSVADEVAN